LKKHHYLVAGEVFFRTPEEEGVTQSVGSIKLNSMLTLSKNQIAARDMGRAQQALQMRFHERMGDPTLQVFDVFLINFSYLGYMTSEQFAADTGLKVPEPTKEALPGLGGDNGAFD
jgi:hypothetical protein